MDAGNGIVPIGAMQLEHAEHITEALAAQFARSGSDFAVINFTDHLGKNRLAVALIADEGIDVGEAGKTWDKRRSWDKIMARKEEGYFKLRLDGREIDVLEHVDGSLLMAIAAINPKINEWVWRTGEKEKATDEGAPIALLSMGRAILDLDFRSDDYKNTRIRPTIVL